MRIESVRIEASGIATIVAAGGFSFSAPLMRFEERGLDFARPGDSRSGGFDVTEEEYAAMEEVASAWSARRKAIELCARAEQSEFGLASKLRARGFRASVAQAAIQELKAEGILSDTRFAEAWTHSRSARKGSNPAAISAGLRARGIPDAAVRKALEEFPVRESLFNAFEAWKAGVDAEAGAGKRVPDQVPSSLKAELRHLGYRSDDIDALWDEWLESLAGKNEY